MDANTNMALKNAWDSVIATVDELRQIDPVSTDLEALQPKVLAQANAAQALRGLVEQLRRKAEAE